MIAARRGNASRSRRSTPTSERTPEAPRRQPRRRRWLRPEARRRSRSQRSACDVSCRRAIHGASACASAIRPRRPPRPRQPLPLPRARPRRRRLRRRFARYDDGGEVARRHVDPRCGTAVALVCRNIDVRVRGGRRTGRRLLAASSPACSTARPLLLGLAVRFGEDEVARGRLGLIVLDGGVSVRRFVGSSASSASAGSTSFLLLDARIGFSASASNVIGVGTAAVSSTSVAKATPSSTRPTVTFTFLPTSFAASRDDHLVAAVDLAHAGRRVVEADLDELQLDRRALLDRCVGSHRLELALREDLEVVEMHMAVFGRGHEEEASPRRRLDALESRPSVADEERQDTRVHRDLERLHPRALRDRAELALDLERVGRVRDDHSVTRRRRDSGS